MKLLTGFSSVLYNNIRVNLPLDKTLFLFLLFSFSVLPFFARGTIVVIPTVEELTRDTKLEENMVVRVLGYYEVGDGGSAEYLVTEKSAKDSLNEYYVELTNGLKALLLKPNTINYKIFGAKGNGVCNDAVEIAKAHAYANANNIPVVNRNGEFWLKEAVKINIQTDVDWGETVFHINEKYNNQRIPRFEVKSRKKPQHITLSDSEKKELIASLNSRENIIPLLEPYKNHLISIADANDRVGFRFGAIYKGASWAKEELFYVEEAGRIIGDVTWSFNDYTKLIAYPVDKNWLNIQGGVFYLSGDSPSSEKGYYRNGIQINRSRTSISNQWVGMEPGKEDTTTINPRTGFYSFNNVYDVALKNVRLIPYLLIRESGRNVHSGTYGISMGRVLRSHFKNVTAEGSRDHWGVFGTNLNKDFKIENCHLNRVDVHFHCWNLTILDSQIGEGGISTTGGGNLIIDNTSCSGSTFLNFRSDYGSRWDGDITITNSTFKVERELSNMYILYFNITDHDYGYPIRFGRNIQVENFKVDFNGVDQKDATCWLMKTPSFSSRKKSGRIILPNFMDFKNIEVVGREKGIRLFSLANQDEYQVDKEGGYQNTSLTTNSVINFNNIQLERLPEDSNQFHFSIDSVKNFDRVDGLYPSVTFINCLNIAVRQQGAAANLFFEKSSISNVFAKEEAPLMGRFVFTDCEFNPVIKDKNEVVYMLDSSIATFFTNCIVNSPMYSGKERADFIDKIGFLKLNESVDFNHSNTILNPVIINFYNGTKNEISPRFLEMLKGKAAPVHSPKDTSELE